ncbi:hypothetical protein [Chryseobacterium sp. MP_3.2]|uniref:hypothetical protein n=1 Tax=Chryseobacterium sp. MP_3.2 TaxID=3071712 RepID=UPI002DFCFCA4|nr:hypothetical protein [Chryseobacterium sp. MP_3.2]
MEYIYQYLELINLKAFCERFDLNYEFTRQVLQGKRTLTDKFKDILVGHLKTYHTSQQNLFKKLN